MSTTNDFDAASEATTNIIKNDPRASTPQLISPPDTRTPPTATAKRVEDASIAPRDPRDLSSEPVSAAALTKALHKIRRDFTPGPSPSRKRARVQHDRYDGYFCCSPHLTALDSCPIDPASTCRPHFRPSLPTRSQARALRQSRSACTPSSTSSEVRQHIEPCIHS
jgi:hypothetical protein